MLASAVEILLAAGDLAAAGTAAEELAVAAGELGAPLLRARSDLATGAILLAEGQHERALASLRAAVAVWRRLQAPYDEARVRVMIGLACRALGDDGSAAMEWDAARATFRRLGADPDVARVDQLAPPASPSTVAGLSRREVEVLVLLAAGMTNRAIATELVISEKTVARHVSNIFTKLGLSSRSAATAYAYEHHLV